MEELKQRSKEQVDPREVDTEPKVATKKPDKIATKIKKEKKKEGEKSVPKPEEAFLNAGKELMGDNAPADSKTPIPPYISIKELVRSTYSRCKNNKWPTLEAHCDIAKEWLEAEGKWTQKR